jgi:hypothetical protein
MTTGKKKTPQQLPHLLEMNVSMTLVEIFVAVNPELNFDSS